MLSQLDARIVILALVNVTLCCTFIGCGPAAGPTRYDVAGLVSVDGAPAAGMLVQLQRQETGSGDEQYPSCITDANGKFQFGGTSTSKGLVEGDYVVTFAWLEGADLAVKDKLQGKLADPKKSSYRIKVPGDNLTDTKFDLKGPK